MSFSEYYKKWKEDNNITEEKQYNPNTTQADIDSTVDDVANRKIETITNRLQQIRNNNNTQNQEQSIWNRVQDTKNGMSFNLSQNTQNEIQQKLAQFKNQGATVNQNGKSITQRETTNKLKLPEVQIANKQYEEQKNNKQIESAEKLINDFKAQKTAEEINENIQKGGADAVNATIENTLNNFSEGVLGAVSGIANVPIMLGAGALDVVEKIIPNASGDIKNNLLNEANRIGNKFTKYTNANPYIENDAVKTTGSVANIIGGMIPSIVSNIIVPGSGVFVQGASAGGKTAQESVNADRDNIGQAITKGIGYGTASGLIEKLTGGNILGKGSLDDFATNFIGNKISSKLGQKIASKGYEFLGENLEEFLENQVDHAIDYAIEGKGVTKEEWINEFNETNKNTLLTTAVLNLLGLGGNTYQEIQNNPNIDQNTKQAVKEVNEAIDKNKLGGKEQLEQFINNEIENNTEELKQQSTQNEQILPTQQITQEQNNVAQNENMEQVVPVQNEYKNQAINEIQNSYLDNKSKQNLIQEINNIEMNEEGLNQIRQIITEESKLDNSATYKTDNSRKRAYMKYKNSDSTYDTTALDIALNSVKENRNGKRTVGQWLEVADNLGKQIADKPNNEIEEIAFRSWHDLQPNTKESITRYDNRNKSNVPFQKFTSDDWVNTIYKAVNETRENSQQNIANSQEQNNVAQNGNMKQITNQQKIDNIVKNKPSFSEQVDQYVAKKYPSGDFLFLGKTPDVLTKLGAPDNQIILKQNKLKTLIEQSNDDTSKLHGVPVETIKRLPEAIANPLNVLKSSTAENSIVIITDLADTKERPIIASIELNYDGQIGNIDFLSNRLTSAYGKNNYDRFMQTEIAKGNLLYDIDEGIIKELPTTRLQSPKGISSSDETSSFINNSISQNDTKVNENTITNNYAQSNENNTKNEQYQATKGETINWNEMERPEGKIRKHYRSIIESSNTTAEAKAIAKEMMGTDTYIPESNNSQIERADKYIENNGVEKALERLREHIENDEITYDNKGLLGSLTHKKVSVDDIALGERLIQYYSKIGDRSNLQDAIHYTAIMGTEAGRAVQVMSLLNHMTPQGQLVWLDRSITKMNNELQQRYGNKENTPQFELTSEMTDKLLNTKNQEDMYKVLDEIYEELGQQVPKTKLEQIDEWRYFSMLANIKTHGRNMIGNLAMGVTQRAKNKVAGAIEGTVAKFNPDMERTHTIVPTSKEVKEFAKNDVKNMDVQTELGMNENKYNPKSRLESSRKTFKSDLLNNTLGKLFDLNSKLLEVEDNIGLKSMYVNSLGEYITANKLDIENMTDAQLSKARQHAIKEAQEATFHQASALATALNQMGRKNNIAKFALDSAIPFKKTPINVAKTGVQYSPVGLIKSAVYDVGKLRKGDITVNQYIDNVSKGLTGTGIAYLGYALAQAGILKASGGDDDKKEKYDEEQGKQTYSIEIGGKTYSLDWLSPVGIPLFIGAEINQQFNTKKKEKNSKSNDDDEFLSQAIQSVANIANASANAINPMSEMSMISGLTSVLSSYNKENAVGDMIVNTGKSYINQFVPTALGQLARTTDDYERTTKSTKTGTLEKAVDSTINQIKSKIPGLRQTLPTKTDIWGKDIKQDANLPFKAFNNFINPSKVQDVSTDKVDKELNSLYAKTGESSIIPKAIDKTFTIDNTNYRMTNEEYAKYYKEYGKTSYNLIKELINTSDYKSLTDEQKQKAIENVYSYAKEANKLDYAKNNKINVNESTLYKTMNELKDKGGEQSSYINYMASTSGMTKESEKNEALLSSNYDSKTKSVIYSNGTGKDDNLYNNIKNSNIDINEYLKYKTQDSNGKFSADKDSNGKSISGTAKEKIYNYVNSNITGYNNKLLILGSKYKLSRSEQEKLANYIYQISTSVEDKNNLFDYYSKNFTINNGKVYYK